MSPVKIFVVYHKPYAVFENSVFQPIQTGEDRSHHHLGFLSDNTGDNIAEKNPWYGELTAWYWVAKNWLPAHPEVKHVGFCHYRRMLDVAHKADFFTRAYQPCDQNRFAELFTSDEFSENAIAGALDQHDIILPPKNRIWSFRHNFTASVFQQYCSSHPRDDLDKAVDLYLKRHPQNRQLAYDFWSGTSFYSCLNFVMRKEFFLDLENWMISFLDELSGYCHWQTYQDYSTIRTPAFIAERFFNIWLAEQKGLSIGHCRRWLLDGSVVPNDIPWYLSGIKQWCLGKLGLKNRNRLPSAFNGLK